MKLSNYTFRRILEDLEINLKIYDLNELKKGIIDEYHEHFRALRDKYQGLINATRIAMDHLRKHPKYYTILDKVFKEFSQ